jgi:phage-related baseplate assembly protein
MGNGNILLDKFHDNKPVSQQEFETILQERHQELESFLHGKERNETMNTKEALQSYKERAASLIYGDEN